MKILAFVDIHGSLKALKKIKKQAKQADILVCAGDFSIFEQALDYFIHEFNRLKKPCLIIHGNHETAPDVRKACSLFKNTIFLHEKTFQKNNHLFLGYGGGGFSTIDKHFDKIAKKFEKKIKAARTINKEAKIILFTHAPPYKTKLDKIMEEYCGNKAIKKFIKKVKPDLVIAGHLHENAGIGDKIGKTRIINPGPFGKLINL